MAGSWLNETVVAQLTCHDLSVSSPTAIPVYTATVRPRDRRRESERVQQESRHTTHMKYDTGRGVARTSVCARQHEYVHEM